MKRFFFLLLALAALLTGGEAYAQRLQNGNYSTVGYLKSDGTIQDDSYRTIGHADSGLKQAWVAWFYFFQK